MSSSFLPSSPSISVFQIPMRGNEQETLTRWAEHLGVSNPHEG